MDKTRKNTVKIVFGSVKAPSYLEVLRFVANGLKIPAPDVHSVYKDENDHCFYIKFLEESKFNQFTVGIEEQYCFEYTDGQRINVKLEVASRLFRYVRIFNLPPETEDKEIAAVLNQFGSVRQHVRERFPADYGYSVFSGIRGVHMEIAKEIPANLHIGHFKVRLYYDGLKNRCFFCKMEGHIKADCPKAASHRISAAAGSYSGVVTGTTPKVPIGSNANPIEPAPLNMTSMPLRSQGSSSTVTNAQKEKTNNSNQKEGAPAEGESSASSTVDNLQEKDNEMDLTEQNETMNPPTSGAGGSKTDSSPTRGRGRGRRQGNEKETDSLLARLDGRSRSRSRSQPKGKSKKK